mgnify:CR=1 FL=1
MTRLPARKRHASRSRTALSAAFAMALCAGAAPAQTLTVAVASALTLVATGVVIGIIWMGRRLVSPWWALGLGMILGGATGNLVEDGMAVGIIAAQSIATQLGPRSD